MPDKLRAAIYCRVAREDQIAITHQETTLRTFAREQGYDNVSVYADNGSNGLSFHQPAFIRMNEDIKAGLIGTVIVNDISRISRNTIDALGWIGGTRQKGVTLKFMRESLAEEPLFNIKEGLLKSYQQRRVPCR